MRNPARRIRCRLHPRRTRQRRQTAHVRQPKQVAHLPVLPRWFAEMAAQPQVTSAHLTMSPEWRMKMASHKKAVKLKGDYVLDYVESLPLTEARYFIGKGRVAGNTSPIPSGLHLTPRKAWQAAAKALNIKAA